MTDKDPIQLLRDARLAIQNQDFPAAIIALRKLVAHANDTGDATGESRHLANLALLLNRLGMSDDALTYMERALKLAEANNDLLTQSGLLGNMGNILRELGRHDEAINRLEGALTAALSLDDVRGRGQWLSNLALVFDDLKDHGKATELHTQSVEIARQMHDKKGLALRLGNLGNSLMNQGLVLDALNAYHEAVEVHRELGDQTALALRLGIIGNIYAELGRVVDNQAQKEAYLVQALSHYRETLHIARDLDDGYTEASILRGMGNVYGNLSRYTEAIQHFVSASKRFEELGMDDALPGLQQSIDMARQLRDEAH